MPGRDIAHTVMQSLNGTKTELLKDREVVDKYKALVAPNCKLDEETAGIICEWIRKGNYIGRACEAAGIDHDTLNRWLKRAENGEAPFMEFAEQLKKADARGEVEAINMITELGHKNWQALMTRIERKYPDRWGQVQRVKQEVSVDPAVIEMLERQLTLSRQLRVVNVIEGEIIAEG